MFDGVISLRCSNFGSARIDVLLLLHCQLSLSSSTQTYSLSHQYYISWKRCGRGSSLHHQRGSGWMNLKHLILPRRLLPDFIENAFLINGWSARNRQGCLGYSIVSRWKWKILFDHCYIEAMQISFGSWDCSWYIDADILLLNVAPRSLLSTTCGKKPATDECRINIATIFTKLRLVLRLDCFCTTSAVSMQECH